MAKALMELFYKGKLSQKVNGLICEHLATCSSCRESYRTYSKNHNLTMFKLFETALMEDFTASKLKEALTVLNEENNYKNIEHCWTDYAKEWDIFKLCQLKSFRDFTKEYSSKGDDGTYDYDEFNKYMALKFCKRIDHLEECYRKPATEEVYNKK